MEKKLTSIYCGILLFTSLLLQPSLSMGQDSDREKRFDSSFNHIATTLAAQNKDLAISQANLLLSGVTDSLQKIKSLMLLATLNERAGKFTEALQFAIKGEKLAAATNNKDWQIRIAGFLSTTFRELGLIANGKRYITIAEKANSGKKSSLLFSIFIYLEKAHYNIEALRFKEALQETLHSIALFQGIPENKRNPIIVAISYELAGYCYLQLDSLRQADIYLKQALALLKDQEDDLKGYIYENFGELALKQNDISAAGKHLEFALNYANASDNFNLKIATFKSLYQYHLARNDKEQAMHSQIKYMELEQARAALTKEVSNNLIETFDQKIKQQNKSSRFWYGISAITIAGTLVFIFYSTLLQREERKKYQAYIEKLSKQKPRLHDTPDDISAADWDKTVSTVTKDQQDGDHLSEVDPISPESLASDTDLERKEVLLMPKETEERILRDLVKLETENFFLEKEVTLAYVCTALKVNSKYLSLVIKKYKARDFNNYINELRINYIVGKLQKNKDYRDYKISYLAEQGGFSSHSKFAMAFKNVTGITPSSFIKNLRKDIA